MNKYLLLLFPLFLLTCESPERIWDNPNDSQNNPVITVISPNGGEYWGTGLIKNITWNSDYTSASNVAIKLYNNGIYNVDIANQENNDGSYTWNIPTNFSTSFNYKIRVSDYNDSTIYDESESSFAIINMDMIFEDDFSSNLNWQTSSYGNFEYINGKFRISSGGDAAYQHYAYKNITPFGGYFEYLVNIDYISGGGGGYGAGIKSADNDIYYFLIRENNHSFLKWGSGWTTLRENECCVEDSGVMKLTYDNSIMRLYYNGDYIDSYAISNETFLGIYLYADMDMEIDYDNIRLYLYDL
ncbi:MAG: hypothetical protein HN815_01530 [Candidatus Marinimicrobia bacterium]|jgi:hypothetical protein|nr:hypothetical protein [Candidatus Neomarinimicrobiota bacterium]MBT6982188.1 hypothetical protein [Candidatus Neomarinimicrobiota bacterium]MBT7372647.1 hypothetical protein [Candidatus Neomarinimicrobiota bacterium]